MLRILVPDQGEIAYLRAGEAFRDMYEKVTGVTLEIIDQYEQGTDFAVIGSDAVNDFTAKAFAADWIDTLRIRYGTDDYALRSVEADGQKYLFLAGGRGRSTLYAVYDYFERVAGCHYYWDGDVIPHCDELPLTGLDVSEKPRFDWRGLRYFAHRGLHRFQAEHWSLEDWKKEIDWMVKRRLNYFMLRIGHDDVFQRAFPEAVDYPSATERLPEAMNGYDDRTLFWPLEYRSVLRKKLLEYAFERDLIHSEDCGTMTHWYSRTPVQYLEKKKPVLLSQATVGYNEQTGLCWDPRVRENLDNYLKITDVYANYYGKPEAFHTIGLAERMIYDDRHENMKMKLFTYRRILQRVREKYPNSTMLIASWDLMCRWHADEVRMLLREFDPQRTLILDYASDLDDPNRAFPAWDLVSKFPWIYGLFHGYLAQNDIRGAYDTTRERLSIAKADPFCKGMIFWPEMSHSDTLALEYLARNSWQPDQLDIGPLAADFARNRYGAYGEAMNAAWQAFLPIVKLVDWSFDSLSQPGDPDYEKYCHNGWDGRVFLMDMLGACVPQTLGQGDWIAHWKYLLGRAAATNDNAPAVLAALAGLPEEALDSPFVRRDAVDIARSLIGRWCHWAILKIILLRRDFMEGADTVPRIEALVSAVRTLSELNAQVLGCHEDYSMYQTLVGLRAVCPVNPLFEATLKRNQVNGYCRQACYEPYRYLFMEEQKAYFDWLLENLRAGNRGEWKAPDPALGEALLNRFMQTPLADMQSPCRGDLPAILRRAAKAIASIRFDR